MLFYDASHDFSQYDNDGDGVIDYFCVIWTGPDRGWGSVWWVWCDMTGWTFKLSPFTIDGKRLGVFSWQWEKNEELGEPVFTPLTMIHETGHALGLPDYYDYDDSVGPDGGVGGMDMMDWNEFDHCCFSKWMLGWVSPTLITTGAQRLFLNPSSETKDCIAVMPASPGINPLSEYFMVQYRKTTGNDSRLPNNGFLIWHVDARLNAMGNNFEYDNSYTKHKLLRLMEADGLEQIETLPEDQSFFDPDDYYVPGQEIGPATVPNSNDYQGMSTGVRVRNLTFEANGTLAADFSIE